MKQFLGPELTCSLQFNHKIYQRRAWFKKRRNVHIFFHSASLFCCFPSIQTNWRVIMHQIDSFTFRIQTLVGVCNATCLFFAWFLLVLSLPFEILSLSPPPTHFPFWDYRKLGRCPFYNMFVSRQWKCVFSPLLLSTPAVDLVNSLSRTHVCFYSTLRIWIRLLFSENACRSFFDVFQMCL